MHSTLKLRESDPHDHFAVAPDVVPASWADKVLADITRDANSPSKSHSRNPASVQPQLARSSAAAGAAIPKVDTTFRATAADDVRVPHIDAPSIHVGSDRPAGLPPTGSRVKRTVTIFLFALCSAFAAAAWQHYGAAATQMISGWTPPFALTSSPPTEKTGLTAPPDTPSVEAAAADQSTPPNVPAVQPSDGTAAAAPSPDAAQLQSMARDLADMRAQIEQLKASIAELRASQQAMAIAKPAEAKPAEAKPSDVKPSEIKPSAPNPRPRISAPPPRPAAARKPMPAYPPAQAAVPLPQQLPPPASLQPAPPPQAATDRDGEPVVRPPMPLH
jgi:hypothetical protein